MNKHQVIWLLIRLVGVYLAFLTLVTLFGLFGSIPALFTLPKLDVNNNKNANVSTMPQNPPIQVQPVQPIYGANSNSQNSNTQTNPNEDSITAKFKGENVKNFAWFLVMTLIYGAITWYLLRDGRILYDVLNREEPQGIKEKEAEVTTLNLSDKQSQD